MYTRFTFNDTALLNLLPHELLVTNYQQYITQKPQTLLAIKLLTRISYCRENHFADCNSCNFVHTFLSGNREIS